METSPRLNGASMIINPGKRKVALRFKTKMLLMTVLELLVGVILVTSIALAIYSGSAEGVGLIALLGILFFYLNGKRTRLSFDLRTLQD